MAYMDVSLQRKKRSRVLENTWQTDTMHRRWNEVYKKLAEKKLKIKIENKKLRPNMSIKSMNINGLNSHLKRKVHFDCIIEQIQCWI